MVKSSARRDDDSLALLRHQTEAQFQQQVMECATLNGWLCWHDNDSRRNVAGFPDLVLVRERVIWVELKKLGGRVSPGQVMWRQTLLAAGAEHYIWYPTDWPTIFRVLERKW